MKRALSIRVCGVIVFALLISCTFELNEGDAVTFIAKRLPVGRKSRLNLRFLVGERRPLQPARLLESV